MQDGAAVVIGGAGRGAGVEHEREARGVALGGEGAGAEVEGGAAVRGERDPRRAQQVRGRPAHRRRRRRVTTRNRDGVGLQVQPGSLEVPTERQPECEGEVADGSMRCADLCMRGRNMDSRANGRSRKRFQMEDRIGINRER